MKRKHLYTLFRSFMLVLISTSLTIFTLHSHNHLEWHHPQKHVDTGHCLTVDSTVCPICGYLYSAELIPAITVEYLHNDFEITNALGPLIEISPYSPRVSGRSPPFSV